MAARASAGALACGLLALLLGGCGTNVGDDSRGSNQSVATGVAINRSATPAPDPAVDLLGLDRTAILALLGSPERLRRDFPAEVWQYLTDACVIDLFFYEQADGYRVMFYEARTLAGDDTDLARCLSTVRPTSKVTS